MLCHDIRASDQLTRNDNRVHSSLIQNCAIPRFWRNSFHITDVNHRAVSTLPNRFNPIANPTFTESSAIVAAPRMDVDKDMSRYWQTFQKQRESLKRANERQGQRPNDRKSKEEAYLQFMMSLKQFTAMKEKEKENKQSHVMLLSVVPPAYLPCTTPLAQLTPTAIRHLRLETHHRGTYLMLRVITPPNRMAAIIVIAEDDQNDVSILQLYQQDREDVREATDVVDVGTILLVKEPYYKVTAMGDYSLRVDHVSDIVHVDKNDSKIPKAWRPRIHDGEESAELFKTRGDSAIKERKYWLAIRE